MWSNVKFTPTFGQRIAYGGLGYLQRGGDDSTLGDNREAFLNSLDFADTGDHHEVTTKTVRKNGTQRHRITEAFKGPRGELVDDDGVEYNVFENDTFYLTEKKDGDDAGYDGGPAPAPRPPPPRRPRRERRRPPRGRAPPRGPPRRLPLRDEADIPTEPEDEDDPRNADWEREMALLDARVAAAEKKDAREEKGDPRSASADWEREMRAFAARVVAAEDKTEKDARRKALMEKGDRRALWKLVARRARDQARDEAREAEFEYESPENPYPDVASEEEADPWKDKRTPLSKKSHWAKDVTSGRKKPAAVLGVPAPSRTASVEPTLAEQREVDDREEAAVLAAMDTLIEQAESILSHDMPFAYYTDLARDFENIPPYYADLRPEFAKVHKRLLAARDAPSRHILEIMRDDVLEMARKEGKKGPAPKRKYRGGMWEGAAEALSKRKRHIVSNTF